MELFCQASSSFTVALGNGCNSVTRITSRIQFLKTQDELLHKAKSLKEKLPGIHSENNVQDKFSWSVRSRWRTRKSQSGRHYKRRWFSFKGNQLLDRNSKPFLDSKPLMTCCASTWMIKFAGYARKHMYQWAQRLRDDKNGTNYTHSQTRTPNKIAPDVS